MIQPCRKQRPVLLMKRRDLRRDAAQRVKLCHRVALALRVVGDECKPAKQQVAQARKRFAESIR